ISKAHEDATRGTTPAAIAPPPQPIEAANAVPPAEITEQTNGNRAPEQQRDSGRQNTGEGDRQWRGRRRRRDGRRGFPDSKFARNDRPREAAPAAAAPALAYEPIILPGESISKYQNRAQQVIAPPTTESESESEGAGPGTEAEALAASTEPLGKTLEHEYQPEQEHDVESHDVTPWATPTWRSHAEENGQRTEPHEELRAQEASSRESQYEQMNVAAVFGAGDVEAEDAEPHEQRDEFSSHPEPHEAQLGSQAQAAGIDASFIPGEGVIEEEEIEGDEDELSAGGEVLEESEYEELEEETLDREHPQAPGTAVPLSEVRNGNLESEAIEGELAEEDEEEDEEEGEGEGLEEAEQFAEGDSSENGRAETRGPAGTA